MGKYQEGLRREPRLNRGRSIAAWVQRLCDAGLVPLPCWGGGKALSGTRFRELADDPPTRSQAAAKDYSGGLAILCGTAHFQGGWVLGVDIDIGPEMFPWRPHGFLLLEMGTSTGKWHIFMRTADRLEGHINLVDSQRQVVCELKGRGLSLRSWPTMPAGKPRGYKTVEIAEIVRKDTHLLGVEQVSEALADLLTRVLRTEVSPVATTYRETGPDHRVGDGSAPGWLQVVYECIVDALEAKGHRFGRSGTGNLLTTCPLHDDHEPSLSLHPQRGWKCWAGCGKGRLTELASLLGISIRRRA